MHSKHIVSMHIIAPAFLLFVPKQHTVYQVYFLGTCARRVYDYTKPQIQAPGTTFSIFSDEVRLEGGHGNCCSFGTLKGVHPKVFCQMFDKVGKFGANHRAELPNILPEKIRGRGCSGRRFVRKFGKTDLFFEGKATQVLVLKYN